MNHIETGSFVSELTEAPPALRVVSWNIARGSQLDAIIEFLATANADIILLQEADRHARRTNYRNVAGEIAQKLKVHYAFGCEFQELAQGSHAAPAHHGQVTLSRWPMADCSILRFQKQSNFWRPRWFLPALGPLQRRVGGRMALLTRALIPGNSLAVYNLHCESKGGDDLRYSQLDEFLQHAKSYNLDVPLLAAGDFNFDLSQNGAEAALADAGFLNPFATLRQATTRSHSTRNGAIDWILLRGPLVGTNPQVHSSVVGSDHYPLSLTVSFS
jgi:endonuclease/exonuclease/phosphatase family metal-dependent hydrolase